MPVVESALALGAVVAPILGDLIGKALSAGDQAEAERLYELAASQYDISPEELVPHVGPSELTRYREDPRLRASQLSALDMYEQGARGGLSAVDRADLADIQQGASRRARAGREAVLSSFRRRGALAPSMELQAQLDAQQDGVELAHRGGLQVAAQGQRRRESALDAFARLAGGLREQDFNQAARVAEANDLIKRFNANNTMQGRMWLMDRKAGAQRARGDLKAGRATATQNTAGGVGAGVGEGFAAGAGYQANQRAADREDERWRQMMELWRPR